jgi:hypothetical protein
MATRVQSLILGLGLSAEDSYNTASADFLRFTKVNMDITSPVSSNETDADWIGKGNEFAENLFKTNTDVSNRIQKFGSAEFLTYILAYGLGVVSETSGVYTITPADPGTTLQLPSFSVVEQIPEGGGSAIDNMYTGCVVDTFAINFSYGPGLKSVTSEMTFRGSGAVTTPSAITVPAVTGEHHALASGMSLSINGVDYVSAATGLTGAFTWNNNLLADEGYFIGSGEDGSGYATRGRLEYGKRVAGFEFTARMLSTSAEYTKLRALTTGTAVMVFPYDATHTVTITLEKVGFTKVENMETNGIVSVKVTAVPMFHLTNGVVSVTAKCGVTGIAQ